MFYLVCLLSTAGILPVPLADHRYNLHRARPEVETELVWSRADSAGHGLTGRGIVICDIDAPPDIFHPMFFKDDRGRFAWIDVDHDGRWSPGDAVDIDGNGLAGADEGLSRLPYLGEAPPGLDRTRFQAGYDFLYHDANGNGVRDFGPPAFTESDPCYGEGIFIADDVDGNLDLDVGESLIGLKTSKIRAIYDRRVFRRGVDLIDYAFPFLESHGTLVCGVLAGGWPGRHSLTGIAPDAELLCATAGSIESLQWARDENADVILWEFAGPFSDGSTEVEKAVDELARAGILFVAAAGNERAPERHVMFSGSGLRTLSNRDSAGITVQFAWRGSTPSEIRISPPGGSSCVFPFQSAYVNSECVQGYLGYRGVSSRGTSYLDLILQSATSIGDWTFSFPGSREALHGFVQYGFQDPGASWVGGDGAYTVTAPGTADSAITVAAYENYPPGDVAWFSGEGPRLDGRRVVDIAAPGVRVLSALPGGARFGSFTGTSAAIPFVAGAAALLKQAFPAMSSSRFRILLARGAARDSMTGNMDRWGAGRLRINGSLVEGLSHPEIGGGTLRIRVSPNPSSGAIEIFWESSQEAEAEVRIFSVTGALVWETRTSPFAGSFLVPWSGFDREGRRAPAGAYYVHVKQDRRIGVGSFIRLE